MSEVTSHGGFSPVHQTFYAKDGSLGTWCQSVDITNNYSSGVTTVVVRLAATNGALAEAQALQPGACAFYAAVKGSKGEPKHSPRYFSLRLNQFRVVSSPDQESLYRKRDRETSPTHELYTKGNQRWRWVMRQSAEVRDFLALIYNALNPRIVRSYIELTFTGIELREVEVETLGKMLEFDLHSSFEGYIITDTIFARYDDPRVLRPDVEWVSPLLKLSFPHQVVVANSDDTPIPVTVSTVLNPLVETVRATFNPWTGVLNVSQPNKLPSPANSSSYYPTSKFYINVPDIKYGF